VISPADVAEQLVSRRTMYYNTNRLSLVACWVKKYIDSNVAASQVLGVNLRGEATWDNELANVAGGSGGRGREGGRVRGSPRSGQRTAGSGDDEDDDDEEGPTGIGGSDDEDEEDDEGGK